MRHLYTPPKLSGHKMLYKGKRYWAFEINQEHPFENYEQDCSIIIYDKLCGGVAAWCDMSGNGQFAGHMPYSQQSIEIEGKTIRDLVQNVDYWTRWVERTEK